MFFYLVKLNTGYLYLNLNIVSTWNKNICGWTQHVYPLSSKTSGCPQATMLAHNTFQSTLLPSGYNYSHKLWWLLYLTYTFCINTVTLWVNESMTFTQYDKTMYSTNIETILKLHAAGNTYCLATQLRFFSMNSPASAFKHYILNCCHRPLLKMHCFRQCLSESLLPLPGNPLL